MKVVIIGAGVIGMMQARELAQRGVDVVLIDKGDLGREASWAGGGIISPLYPWRYSDPVTTLASWSQEAYPELIQALASESQIDPELSNHGLLMLEVEDKPFALAWSERAGAWIESVGGAMLAKLEPCLKHGVESGLWMSRVSSVRNPRLLKALRKIMHQHPKIDVRIGQEVVSLMSQEHRCRGVVLANRDVILSDRVVVASGAWTSKLLAMDAVKVYPVKGQMLIFDAKPGVVNRVVLSEGKYVIPRRDGKVVVGSTLEHCDFDKQTTKAARQELIASATDLFPALADYPVTHHWAGLRPASPKGIPFIGGLPGYEGLFVNAGHFRNGLVLAPASVRLMTQMLTDDALPFDATPYIPEPSIALDII